MTITAQTKEFIVGLSGVEGSEKYTPRAATVNGIAGRIWVKRILKDGAWIHQGTQHVRNAANEAEVTAAFVENEIDHDSVDAYWGSN